jgi:hypothetical protein
MKGQQIEMALLLRSGAFDEIIAGRAVGGMELLEHPPKAEVQKLATQKKQRVQAGESVAEQAPAPERARQAAPQAVLFRLHVTRSLTGGPASYASTGAETVIGASGGIALPGERFCHVREAAIVARDGRMWLKDFEGGNGVFLRIRAPVVLMPGDEFVVGDQLLRVDRNPKPDDMPGEGPTYFYSSPRWMSSFRVAQIFQGGALGACAVAHGTALLIGSTQGSDLSLRGDPLVSKHHCLVEEQAGDIMVTDLESPTGVFVRIKGEQELVHGDELLVGRTRLMLEKC